MIVVAAKMKAVEGKGDELEQEFRKLIPKVLKDPGAITYAVHRKANAPNEFLVYEKYDNGEALSNRFRKPSHLCWTADPRLAYIMSLPS